LDELLVPRSGASGTYVPSKLARLSQALTLVLQRARKHEAEVARRLELAWTRDEGTAHGTIAEVTALGLLADVFPKIEPLPHKRKQKTPDYTVIGSFNVEVFAPRDSQTDRANVEGELSGPKREELVVDVRIAISHPITGSNPDALRFPANKTALRLLGNKWDKDQAIAGEPNVLYVDVQDWVECALATSTCSYMCKDIHCVGTFGAWHAFYGQRGRRTMVGDRAATSFLPFFDVAYEQDVQGFFRDRHQWSAAILVTKDGAVLFENPWANMPLAEDDLRRLLRIDRCKTEHSWFRGPHGLERLRDRVEDELDRLEWLFARSRDGKEESS
jgi:hypothetical protein